MKHFLATISFILAFASVTNSQSLISLGAKAGINVPGLTMTSSNPVLSGYKTLLAPNYGVVLETGLNKKWSLLNEFNYSSIYITKSGDQIIPASALSYLQFVGINLNQNLYSNFTTKIKINYIEFPLMLKYYIYQNDNFNVYAYGGFFTGVLTHSQVNTNGFNQIFNDAQHQHPFTPIKIFLSGQETINDRLNTINFGMQGGAGITAKGDIGELFFNIGGNYGFTTMQLSSDDGQNQTRALSVTAGYLFHLSRYKK